MQTDQNIDVTTITDLNDAPSGKALFDTSSANIPSGVTGAGIVHTERQGDIGWQMMIANDTPREFWQRTRKPAAPYWRNWRKFVDFRTVNDAITAALVATSEADAAALKTLIAEHGADEVIARDAAIATERAAIDRSVDSKTGIIDAKVTTLDGKLETERNDRVAAITAEARKHDTALTTERTTREAAITAERDARHSAIHAQRTELKNAIANIVPDFDAHIASIIQTERGDRTTAIMDESDKLRVAITNEADTRENAIRTLDTKVTGDIAEARRVITGDIATAVATERDARKAADRAVTTQIANSGFASGTKMLFRQSNAPTGWTKDTAHNDKALRMVSGSAGSGGTNGFKSRFGQDQIDVTSTISGQTAGHAITEAQMPSHNHGSALKLAPRIQESYLELATSSHGQRVSINPYRNRGDDQPHSHGVGTLEVSSSIALDVAYVDVIIATKD